MKFVKSTYLRSIGVQIICLILFGLAGIASAGKIDDVRARVYAWCKSWQHRDIKTYMTFYSPDFRSHGLDYRGWIQKKKRRFKIVHDLRVDIFDLGVFIEGDSAVASFIQRYQDPKISDVGEKTLTMIYTDGKWEIVSEVWKPLKASPRIIREATLRPLAKKIAPTPSPVGHAKKNKDLKVLSQNSIIIKSIKLELKKKLERLFIASNKYFVPKILTLEGDHPKIVIDIKPVFSWNGPYRTPANGNLIRQIRTYMHPKSKTLRIVLDLKPSENYYIDQIYYEKRNIYCLEIR
jgi:ketosteroid isomerase-like protein